MDSHGKTKTSQATARALDYFDKFCAADSIESVMSLHQKLCDVIQVKPSVFPVFFPKVMKLLASSDARELLSKYEKRAANKNYENGNSSKGSRVLIIGAGPCGLRTAIEAQLMGAKVVVIEKRGSFSRNNVLHLWPFVINDLKGLGAKKFYGKFCPGSLDHISISTLQFILLKVALLIGVQVHFGVGFEEVLEPCGEGETKQGWRAKLTPVDHALSNYEFDVLLGANGRQNTLKGFKRKVLRAKLAIAITANFVNKRTAAEAKVQEISGVSFIFKQDFFNELCEATGIDLENIVYYKDETHYFVMTAKKHSLLWKGVLYNDCADTEMLLAPDNVNRDALEDYVLEAVNFATDYKLPKLQFALNYRHEPDVALIDFTAMYAAENACRVIQRKGFKLLLGLVGDSLLEPFWPTGSGCARGFLSSLDMCWTIRSWAKGSKTPVEVIAERESIYRLLAQTTHENLAKDYNQYTVEPCTRYPHINLGTVKPFQVQTLLDSDEIQPVAAVGSKPHKTPVPNGLSAHKKNKHMDEKELEQSLPKTTTPNQPSKEAETEDFPDLDKLLDWFKEQVRSYDLKVDGIQDVFVHGNVLCAILNRYRPDLLPDFPLPPEVQQGNDEVGQAAFRNQLAFDFIKGEYAIPSFVDGLDAVLNVSSNLSSLIDFSVKVYEMFRNQEPRLPIPANPKINITPHSEPFDTSEATNDLTLSASPEFSAPASPQGYVSCVWTSNSNFLEGSGIDADQEFNSNSLRRVKRSSSIQRIVQRLDNSGLETTKPVVRSHSFRTYKDSIPSDRRASCEVVFNPYNTINNETRRKRLEEAEKSKVETLRLMHVMKTKQKEERDEERAAERERLIRAMRAESSEPPPEISTSNFKTVNQDEFFNEYNMRLWRQSRPSIGERTQNLETKLAGAALERKSSFNEAPARNKLRQSLTAGLQRSATECHIKSQVLPTNVQKFRKDDATLSSLGTKMAEGHGQVSVKTSFSPKTNVVKQTLTIPAPVVKKPSQIGTGSLSHSPSATHIKSVRKEIPAQATPVPPTSKAEGLKKSASVSCISKDGKTEQGAKKKNDFSEYFRAKEAAMLKQQKSKITITPAKPKTPLDSKPEQPQDFSEYFRAKEAALLKQQKSKISITPSKPKQEQPQDEVRKRSVAEVKQNKVHVNESIIKKTVRLAEGKPQVKLQTLNHPASASKHHHHQHKHSVTEKAQYEMKPEGPKQSNPSPVPPPASVARQNTVEEFDSLFGITEDDEEILSELNPEELNQLLDWTEKNFHVRRGVDTE